MNDQDEDYDMIRSNLESDRKQSFHVGRTTSQSDDGEEQKQQIIAGDPEFNTHKDRDNKLIKTNSEAYDSNTQN